MHLDHVVMPFETDYVSFIVGCDIQTEKSEAFFTQYQFHVSFFSLCLGVVFLNMSYY